MVDISCCNSDTFCKSKFLDLFRVRVRGMVFKATFNNISYIFITTDSIGVFQLLWILVLHNKISCIISNNKYAMVQHKYKHWCLLSSVSAFLTMILKSIFG
jgi:hypothetical protein